MLALLGHPFVRMTATLATAGIAINHTTLEATRRQVLSPLAVRGMRATVKAVAEASGADCWHLDQDVRTNPWRGGLVGAGAGAGGGAGGGVAAGSVGGGGGSVGCSGVGGVARAVSVERAAGDVPFSPRETVLLAPAMVAAVRSSASSPRTPPSPRSPREHEEWGWGTPLETIYSTQHSQEEEEEEKEEEEEEEVVVVVEEVEVVEVVVVVGLRRT